MSEIYYAGVNVMPVSPHLGRGVGDTTGLGGNLCCIDAPGGRDLSRLSSLPLVLVQYWFLHKKVPLVVGDCVFLGDPNLQTPTFPRGGVGGALH